MPSDPAHDFLEALQRSGLVPAPELEKLTAEFKGEVSTSHDAAARLVERKVLSGYQAEQLLAGRGEECVLAGRYHLVERLGAGGMGEVFRARDTKLDRLVAIKVIAPQLVSDPDAVARFQREARALAKVAHAGIVQVHDTGEDQGRHFLVMEYVEGVGLNRVLQEQGRISPALAADYVCQAALALKHAHERGLVHRDVKPANLLLTPQHHVKLLDLGLARFVQDQIAEPGLTREGTGVGTPDYMAPEQFRDAHAADERADIYALGCTLYHLLAGRPPFPGSSYAEKRVAHQEQEPAALEMLCREVPAGLAVVVRRMMAKRPADRYRSAAEVADALAPHVAGSSVIRPHIEAAASHFGSRATMTMPSSSRLRVWRWVGAGTAVAAFLALAILAWPGLFPDEEPTPDRSPDAAKDQGVAAAASEPKPAAPVDPNVLTVSKDAKDGGQFRSINEALEKVKPGQTIRVLDKAVYPEFVAINSPSQHRGITLESPLGATIENRRQMEYGVGISGVSEVTLRGFRIRAVSGPLIRIEGPASGVVLDDLELAGEGGYDAIALFGVNNETNQPPTIVQNCSLNRPRIGIAIYGVAQDYRSPLLSRRVIVRNNSINTPALYGIAAIGNCHDVHLVGNRIWRASPMGGIQLINLRKGCEGILIANNTLFECAAAFRLWDGSVEGKSVRISNNLILGSGQPDMVFIDSGGDFLKFRGPGDGQLVTRTWKLDGNWREVKTPVGDDLHSKSWIPPGPKDERRDEILVLSRDPTHPDFLRPAKDSPLATEGAGKTDPRLPSYVGAVPPEGISPWDWDRTWRMPADAQLLTVSKDSKDGGQFRTINDALKVAKPWATIRILDDAVYNERLLIDDPARHEGIVLEAPRRATLVLPSKWPIALAIKGVPHVTVRSFRFRTSAASRGAVLVAASLDLAGLSLEGLDVQSTGEVFGITIANPRLGEAGAPIRVSKCRVDVPLDGITVVGAARTSPPLPPSPVRRGGLGGEVGGLMILDNRVGNNMRGILLQGGLRRVLVAGNVVWNCSQSGLQFQDLAEDSEQVVLANNTAFDSLYGFRAWDDAPYEQPAARAIEFTNNLFFDATHADMGAIRRSKGGDDSPHEGAALLRTWRFSHNFRDGSGSKTAIMLPLAAGDRRLDKITLLSRNAADRDFARSPADSPLAKEGAGKEDPSLPAYVGAVPPKGVPAWDWDKTWRWRVKRAAPSEQTPK